MKTRKLSLGEKQTILEKVKNHRHCINIGYIQYKNLDFVEKERNK